MTTNSIFDPVADFENWLLGAGAGNGATGEGVLGSAFHALGLGAFNNSSGAGTPGGLLGSVGAALLGPAPGAGKPRNNTLFTSGWAQIFGSVVLIIIGLIIMIQALKVPAYIVQTVNTVKGAVA